MLLKKREKNLYVAVGELQNQQTVVKDYQCMQVKKKKIEHQ